MADVYKPDLSVKQAMRTQHLPHIRELDGLRGIAAVMVLLHHVCGISYPDGGTALITWCSRVSLPGRTGVDLFFVLSGFLISSLLIKARRSSRYYQDFYWKRALRVLPLYMVCLIAVALFQRGALSGVLLAAVFLANFASVLHVAFIGPFWTLAIEEQFYILWPTVVRRRTVEELQHWALGIGVGCITLRLAAAWFGHYNYYLSFLRCDALAYGAMLGCWFIHRGERLGGARRERLALPLSMVFGAVLCVLGTRMPTPTLRSTAFGAAFLQTGVTLLAGSLVGFLIQHRNAPLLAILRSRLLTFFGLISYALYMFHMGVMAVWDHVMGLPRTDSNVAFAERTLCVSLISIGLAVLSRYVVELPAMSLRRYVLPPPA